MVRSRTLEPQFRSVCNQRRLIDWLTAIWRSRGLPRRCIVDVASPSSESLRLCRLFDGLAVCCTGMSGDRPQCGHASDSVSRPSMPSSTILGTDAHIISDSVLSSSSSRLGPRSVGRISAASQFDCVLAPSWLCGLYPPYASASRRGADPARMSAIAARRIGELGSVRDSGAARRPAQSCTAGNSPTLALVPHAAPNVAHADVVWRPTSLARHDSALHARSRPPTLRPGHCTADARSRPPIRNLRPRPLSLEGPRHAHRRRECRPGGEQLPQGATIRRSLG